MFRFLWSWRCVRACGVSSLLWSRWGRGLRGHQVGYRSDRAFSWGILLGQLVKKSTVLLPTPLLIQLWSHTWSHHTVQAVHTIWWYRYCGGPHGAELVILSDATHAWVVFIISDSQLNQHFSWCQIQFRILNAFIVSYFIVPSLHNLTWFFYSHEQTWWMSDLTCEIQTSVPLLGISSRVNGQVQSQ